MGENVITDNEENLCLEIKTNWGIGISHHLATAIEKKVKWYLDF